MGAYPGRPLRLMHDYDPAHLRHVGGEMRRLGPPTITCVFTDDALYALEGVHRLHAAAGLDIGATLHCIPPGQVFTYGDRDAFFDRQYRSVFEGEGDLTAIEMVRMWDDWPVTLQATGTAIPAPGYYENVCIGTGRFGGLWPVVNALGRVNG